MNNPRRLRESGGVSERLLDSASIDKPSRASRARAVELASTAGTFVTSTAGAAVAAKAGASITGFALYQSVAMWVCIGAIGGGTVALIGTELLAPSANPSTQSGARPTATPLPLFTPEHAVAEPPQDIKPEPAVPLNPSASRPLQTHSPPSQSAVAEWSALYEIEAAREAILRADPREALRILDGYETTHPNSPLRAEAARLRTQALRESAHNPSPGAFAGDVKGAFNLDSRRAPATPN